MKLFPAWRRVAKTAGLVYQNKPWVNFRPGVSATPRVLSTSTSTTPTGESKVKKVVLVSSSQSIFENLALEEWLYDNAALAGTDYLLMWRNTPAVVIGRHQNPWTECDVGRAMRSGIDVVRRNSGGGTVYHDEGNLNLSFLMHRSRYDRRRNLTLVKEAVTSRWNLDLDLNSRDDLVLDGVYKVSGTAAKLARDKSYHHLTLIFAVNKDLLSSILHSPLTGVSSNATPSVPSPVKNLGEDAPDMTFDSLVQVIGHRFLQDEGSQEVNVVDPTNEEKFPGVTTSQRRLQSWQWIFGKTPPFSLSRTFVTERPNGSGSSVLTNRPDRPGHGDSGVIHRPNTSGNDSSGNDSSVLTNRPDRPGHGDSSVTNRPNINNSSVITNRPNTNNSSILTNRPNTNDKDSSGNDLSSVTHSPNTNTTTTNSNNNNNNDIANTTAAAELEEASRRGVGGGRGGGGGGGCQYSLTVALTVEKGMLRNLTLSLSTREPCGSRHIDADVDVAFRLLDVVGAEENVVGGGWRWKGWKGCGEVLGEGEEEGRKGVEDYALLRWGLQCLIKCVPVGGRVGEEGERGGWWWGGSE